MPDKGNSAGHKRGIGKTISKMETVKRRIRMSKFNLDTEFCKQCGWDGGLCNNCVKKKCYEQGKADTITEIHSDLVTEIALLNATDMTEANLYTFAVRIKEITDKIHLRVE